MCVIQKLISIWSATEGKKKELSEVISVLWHKWFVLYKTWDTFISYLYFWVCWNYAQAYFAIGDLQVTTESPPRAYFAIGDIQVTSPVLPAGYEPKSFQQD